ncbi:hypothetical protein DM02DRAFT_669918 [Periconia macrospinosa]|uniref:MARVEL domain-containing protein n=1 Tax=Periconia macrospinosa TaxID=97972 RepID=A0A2V1DZE7_9PLEO|nr:hypothetical protein DM02DRAFT_669918 [Periconia macrospinosa]
MPIRPATFRDAVNARLSRPVVGLFKLGVPVLQLVFALASGISYALELSHNNTSVFIYSQVVFGLTLAMLIGDAVTIRSYKLVFVFESVVCILWLALFGSCYMIFFDSSAPLEPQYSNVNMRRMKNAVWLDLINFVLWLSSAAFSTTMCCSGTNALIRGKWKSMRAKKTAGKPDQRSDMETGLMPPAPALTTEEQLPAYEDVAEPEAAERLPLSYSRKALSVKNVAPSDVWYASGPESVIESHVFPPDSAFTQGEAAVALASVGQGKLGFMGDVNAEAGSTTVLLGLCGFL